MVSKLVKNMFPSATLELTAKVAELKANGIDIISLNVGEPDFTTPKNICEAAKKAIDEGFTHYTPVPGILELRKKIADKLKNDNNVLYNPSQIIVGTGAKQPIANSILAICDEKDEVIIPTPCWVSYVEMIKIAGAIPVLVSTDESKGFALDFEKIEKAITNKTKAILINTPNNPTGAVYSEESLRKLSNLALKYNFYIISDEVYEKLIYGDAKHFCIASISEEVKEKTIIINGFSKAYAMTGWRMGYAAGPQDVIKGMNDIQGHMTSGANSITQKACIEALVGPQNSIEEMRIEFSKRREYLQNRLQSIDKVTCANAEGAFYLMPNVSKFFGKVYKGKEMKTSKDITTFLLEEAHVAVVSGEDFYAKENLRISYSNSMDNIKEAADRMERAFYLLK